MASLITTKWTRNAQGTGMHAKQRARPEPNERTGLEKVYNNFKTREIITVSDPWTFL